MQKDVNFFSIYRSPIESDSGVDKVTLIGLSVIAACLIGFAGMYSYLKVSDISTRTKAQNITAYLNSTEVKNAEAAWNKYLIQLNALKDYQQKANSETNAFNNLKTVDSSLLGGIFSKMPADVTLQELKLDNNVLTLNCSCTDKLSPANFARALQADTQIDSVSYDKVEQNDTKTAYVFALTCEVKGSATK